MAPETATSPRLTGTWIGGVFATPNGLPIHTPGVDASKDCGCSLDLLSDVLPDHRVEHRTQFHPVDDIVSFAASPQILGHTVYIASEILVVLESVVLDVLHELGHTLLDSGFVQRRVHASCEQCHRGVHGTEEVVLERSRLSSFI